MKKAAVFCLSALSFFAVGCKDQPKTPSAQEQEQGTLPVSSQDTVIPPPEDSTDTPAAAKTDAASWYGNYSGSLPCGGDCKGILTRITLNANKTYTLSSQAIGRDKEPAVYQGEYTLDDKNIVTLDAEGDHLKFLVMEKEEMLKKLDKFGAEEQGAPQARYFLHKAQ